MVTACAFVGCTSKKGVDSKKTNQVTFHKFPKDSKRSKLWTQFVNRKNWRPSKYSVLCCKHFKEEYIDRTSLSSVRLRANAIPTIVRPELSTETFHTPIADISTKNWGLVLMPTVVYSVISDKASEFLASTSNPSVTVPATLPVLNSNFPVLSENNDSVATNISVASDPTLDHNYNATPISENKNTLISSQLVLERKLERTKRVCFNRQRKIKQLSQVIYQQRKKITAMQNMIKMLQDQLVPQSELIKIVFTND